MNATLVPLKPNGLPSDAAHRAMLDNIDTRLEMDRVAAAQRKLIGATPVLVVAHPADAAGILFAQFAAQHTGHLDLVRPTVLALAADDLRGAIRRMFAEAVEIESSLDDQIDRAALIRGGFAVLSLAGGAWQTRAFGLPSNGGHPIGRA